MYGVCGKEERVPGENIKLVPHKVVSPEFTLNSCTIGSLRVGLTDMVKKSIQYSGEGATGDSWRWALIGDLYGIGPFLVLTTHAARKKWRKGNDL